MISCKNKLRLVQYFTKFNHPIFNLSRFEYYDLLEEIYENSFENLFICDKFRYRSILIRQLKIGISASFSDMNVLKNQGRTISIIL